MKHDYRTLILSLVYGDFKFSPYSSMDYGLNVQYSELTVYSYISKLTVVL